MKTITQASFALILLISYGCGPGNTFAPHSQAPTVNKASCIDVNSQSISEANHSVVTLNKDVVNNVLNELANKSFDLRTFWTDLSDESLDILNFSINASIKKTRPANYRTIYQATAMFFSKIMGNYKSGYDYRIKDISGHVISFVNWGVKNPIVIDLSSTCDSTLGLDLSFIRIPSKLIMIDEVKNLVICRLPENRHFLVMNARKSLMVMSGEKFAKASRSEGSVDENKNKLKIKIHSDHLNMNLNMKKNTEMAIGDRVSNKTTISLTMPDFDVNEIGACHEQ